MLSSLDLDISIICEAGEALIALLLGQFISLLYQDDMIGEPLVD
jgi:hypothetical protein